MLTNPIAIRRLECALLMFVAMFAYQRLGFSWGFFAVLFFVPDLSIPVCAFDRSIGWGLEYPDSFCNTSMGMQTLPIDIPYLR